MSLHDEGIIYEAEEVSLCRGEMLKVDYLTSPLGSEVSTNPCRVGRRLNSPKSLDFYMHQQYPRGLGWEMLN